MDLSHYVFEEGDRLFNLTTTESVPKDSDEETLRRHFFLKGQEQDAIHHRLFNWPVDQVGLKINPTWKCNLRCRHCFVLQKLVKEDPEKLDPKRIQTFVNSILDTIQINKLGLSFIGGEAMLEAQNCIDIYDQTKARLEGTGIKLFTTMTTNGTVWNREAAELMSRMDTLVISLDGNREAHNKQRKGLDVLQGADLFEITLRNIKRCVLMGWGEKMRVQASLYDDTFNKKVVQEFCKAVLATGLNENQIIVGSAVPTRLNSVQTELYQRYLATFIYNRPCCKYRLGKEFVVDVTGDVYCDYFDHAEHSVLGTLETPFFEIMEKHKELILNTMPVLSDPKCQSCPVIGACWGRCCNTEFLKPSSLCNQQALKDLCLKEAEEGTLMNHYKGKNHAPQLQI